MQSRIKEGLFQGVDFLTVLYYLLLVAAGCICITAASYDEESASFFAFSHFYIKQYLWVGAVLIVALIVLLLDVRFYHMWAYPLYIAGIAVMVGVLIAGKEVNGAKSWIELGSFRIQPVEFVKIATALALARVMSNYSFSINRAGDLLRVGFIIGLPMLLTILQNDTGSGVVLGAFLFVLYREGLNKWLCIPILLIAALFIVSFLLTPMTLLILLILICTLSEAMMNGKWRSRIIYLAALALASTLLCALMALIAPNTMNIYRCLLVVTLLSLPLMLDFLPTFNRMMSGRVSIGFFLSGAVLPVILLFILALSVIPAFYMSQRIAALSHAGYRELASGGRKQRLVTALSIAQFAISIGLVFATITVRGQLALTRANGDRYRGLIEVTDWSGEHIQAFAQEISGDPAIEEMSLAKGALFNFMLRQLILKDEQGNERYYTLAQFAGDSTFLRITRQRVLRGMSEREALQRYAMPVYINERYAEVLVPKGENPVGKPVRMYDAEFGKNDMGLEKKGADSQAFIAGVIENLYTGTLRQEVHPALTYLNSKEPDHVVLLRVRDEGKAETIDRIRAAWEKVNPNEPVIYQDLYEEFMRMNQKTIQLAELLTLYSVISLVLTASGLFGMALYAIERRTKEIGIRKVNGASTGEILRMLNLRFVGWVGVAFVIAIPVTWYFLGEWLKSFVYRIDVSPWTALLSGCAVLLVTLLTVSGHSYRAATRNPVKALRSE